MLRVGFVRGVLVLDLVFYLWVWHVAGCSLTVRERWGWGWGLRGSGASRVTE